MKISVCSDIHLEFGTISLENKDDADVLVLSGDVCVAVDLRERDVYEVMGNDKSSTYHKFFQECCSRFKHVVYVAGNHEHYHGDYKYTVERLRHHLGYLSNLHILDKEFVDLEGVCFVGGTLWTNMNKEDPITLQHIRGYMNDYRIIENSNEMVNFTTPIYQDGKVVSKEFHTRPAKFKPQDSVKDHNAMMQCIKDAIDSRPNEKWVVVGHHAPCKMSSKPSHRGDYHVNGAYSSDLSEFILDHPQIKLWTHGHTHDVYDYMIGTTRIFCNPRGYIEYEDRADQFQLLTVEV